MIVSLRVNATPSIVAVVAVTETSAAIRQSREDERLKERRNPSAAAHDQPMSEREPLPIVSSWARAISYRPSLLHRLSLAFL